MPNFEQLRVSLDSAEDVSFDPAIFDRPVSSRADFLIWAFSEEREFLVKKRKIAYVPIETPTGYLAGFFATEKDISARPRQRNAFPEVTHENWELALFVINIESSSQIVWMEVGSAVGAPKSVLESYFDSLPKGSPYRAAIRYMSTDATYWAAVESHRSRITKLVFEFLPPNALGGRDKVQNFVRDAQKTGNPTTQKHIYTAPPGKMDPTSEILEGSAEVALEGAGKASIFAGAKKVWSSSGNRSTESIDEEIMPTVEDPTFISAIIDRLYKWRTK